jgi:3-hydroxybutyryl-CoA dehydrogenase
MKLVVVGAGTMGQGIAQVAIAAGWTTCLVDVTEDVLDSARAAIARRLQRAQADSSDRTTAAADRLAVTIDLADACVGADVVVETASEDLSVKIGILSTALAASPPQALIGTNTSALSITEMGAASGAPERVVGIHFFNPVPKMRLVEVISGLDSAAGAITGAVEFARSLGKEPVVLRDSPGFVASRMNALIGNEAFSMLAEGVASAEDIDTALKLGLNHPMGPFELGDLVGWDVRLKVLQYLHSTLGDRFRPSPLMLKYVESGRLGRKTGRGVYEYPPS